MSTRPNLSSLGRYSSIFSLSLFLTSGYLCNNYKITFFVYIFLKALFLQVLIDFEKQTKTKKNAHKKGKKFNVERQYCYFIMLVSCLVKRFSKIQHLSFYYKYPLLLEMKLRHVRALRVLCSHLLQK